MKCSLFLLTISFFSVYLKAQTVLVKDSTSITNHSGSGGQEVYTYLYNSDCLLSVKENTDPNNHIRYTYTYYPNHNLFQMTTKTFAGDGSVTGNRRVTYVYKGNGQVKSILSQVWQRSRYVNETFTNNVYNSKNLLTLKHEYTWDTGKLRFISTKLDSSVYTCQNQVSQVFRFQYLNGVKTLAFRADTLYNPNGTVDSTADYNFIDFEVRAISASQYHYTYNDTINHRYEIVKVYRESYNPGGWGYVNTRTLRHDSANYVSHDTTTNTNYGSLSIWVTRTYNTDETLASVFTFSHYLNDNRGDVAVYTGYVYGICGEAVSAPLARTALLTGLSPNEAALSVSPNPAVNFFTIRCHTDHSLKLNATLYDAGGRARWTSGLISADALNNKQVATGGFANGIYYLRVTNANGAMQSNVKVMVAH